MTNALVETPSAASWIEGKRETLPLVQQDEQITFYSCVTQLTHPIDPIGFLHAGSAALGGGALFWQPAQRKTLVSLGTAYVHETGGPGRFRSLAESLKAFSRSLVRSDQNGFPVLAGGAFHDYVDEGSVWRDFPAATVIVPRLLLQMDEAETALRITIPIGTDRSSCDVDDEVKTLLSSARDWARSPLATPVPPKSIEHRCCDDRFAWEGVVANAVQMIQQLKLEKVVLAREERLQATEPFSPIGTLNRLRATDPNATLFAISRADRWFIGASPERLVRLVDGKVDVTCLAGSIGLGNSDDERRVLASELLRSSKNRQEHELVVAPIVRALEEVCDDVERLPGTPRVVAARSVQHLETPMSGRLRGSGHVLDLVQRLHPTPAVGGYPRGAALQAIEELEHIERGWYAGPFGWTDLDGNGEFIVALRSALITGSTATLFAGCGIVADSEPSHEYEESRLKMRPMQAALGVL